MQDKMHAKKKLMSALILGAFASGAGASGFQLIEQTASGIGNAYAGSAAVAENASTIFYNPAGMSELQGTQASVGLAAIKPSFKFTNGNSSSNLVGNGGDAGRWGFVPNAYLSSSLSKDWSVGLGIGAPFGLMTNYDKPWIGGAQSEKFDIKTLNINPSLAFRMNDVVTVAGGLNHQRLEAVYERIASSTNLPASVNPVLPALNSTLVTMNVSDEATGWNVGTLIKLTPDTKLGLSYRSKMKYEASGNITASGNSLGVLALTSAGRVANVKAKIDLPDTFIASLAHQLDDRWQLLGDVSWTGWSSIPKIDIMYTSGALSGTKAQTLDTQFRDTWRIAVGANYKYSDTLKLKMGVAYDQTPVKSESTRLVSMPDNDRIWFSFGSQFQLANNSVVDLGIAYLYVRDAKINNNQSSVGTSDRGTVNGTYKDSGLILGAQYSVKF